MNRQSGGGPAGWTRALRFAALALAVVLHSRSGHAAEAMTYIYNATESSLDVRYLYHWEILRMALEKTQAKWGPYRMVPSEVMTERRQTFELKNATGKLTVMYLSTTPDFEKTLIPIHIPVDKNLGGYCVFLIRRENRERFAAVNSIDDLDRFSYGLGLGWIDVDILKAGGFKVVTGSSYDGLFEMLVNRRFDIFLRAAVEVLDEYDQRKKAMPALYIEDGLLFYYPLPMYFWFPKTDEGRRLAARAEEGMRMMIADGSRSTASSSAPAARSGDASGTPAGSSCRGTARRSPGTSLSRSGQSPSTAMTSEAFACSCRRDSRRGICARPFCESSSQSWLSSCCSSSWPTSRSGEQSCGHSSRSSVTPPQYAPAMSLR